MPLVPLGLSVPSVHRRGGCRLSLGDVASGHLPVLLRQPGRGFGLQLSASQTVVHDVTDLFEDRLDTRPINMHFAVEGQNAAGLRSHADNVCVEARWQECTHIAEADWHNGHIINEVQSAHRLHFAVGIEDQLGRRHSLLLGVLGARSKMPLLFGSPKVGEDSGGQVVVPLHIHLCLALLHHAHLELVIARPTSCDGLIAELGSTGDAVFGVTDDGCLSTHLSALLCALIREVSQVHSSHHQV